MGRVKGLLEVDDAIAAGYVYCLTNPAMPGLVKIGYTRRTPQERSRELFAGYQGNSATGVPMPFDVVKEWRVPANKAEEIEQQIHRLLDPYRVKAHGGMKPKEFFHLAPSKAIAEVESALKQLDWWAVSQAENQEFEAAAIAKIKRDESAAAEARELRLAETRRKAEEVRGERAIEDELQRQMVLLRQSLAPRFEASDNMTGYKVGFWWAVGSFVFFFGFLNAKDGALWVCGLIGVIAYFFGKGTGLNDYLQTPEGKRQVAEIETKVRRRLANLSCPCLGCSRTISIPYRPSDDAVIRCMQCRQKFPWSHYVEKWNP